MSPRELEMSNGLTNGQPPVNRWPAEGQSHVQCSQGFIDFRSDWPRFKKNVAGTAIGLCLKRGSDRLCTKKGVKQKRGQTRSHSGPIGTLTTTGGGQTPFFVQSRSDPCPQGSNRTSRTMGRGSDPVLRQSPAVGTSR